MTTSWAPEGGPWVTWSPFSPKSAKGQAPIARRVSITLRRAICERFAPGRERDAWLAWVQRLSPSTTLEPVKDREESECNEDKARYGPR